MRARRDPHPTLRRLSVRRLLRRVRDEVDEEIEAHFRGTVDLLVDRGMTEEEAQAEARQRFGDVERYRKKMKRIQRARARKGMLGEWLAGMVSGLAFARREFSRSPGFAFTVIATLVLGLGVNATMFTVIDRLLVSPPRYVRDAGALRRYYVRRVLPGGARVTSGAFTRLDVEDLVGLPAFQQVAAWSSGNAMTIGNGENAERINVTIASWRLFPLLGVTAERGRFFSEEEDRVGAPGTVVLSHELWESRFVGDPGILGRILRIGEGRYQVIGIAPPSFTGADLSPVDAWLPLLPGGVAENGKGWIENRSWWWLSVAGRLAPGVTDRLAAAEATVAHRAGHEGMAGYDPGARIVLEPLLTTRAPGLDRRASVARWLGGVSILVLLIACANVANLLLTRGIRRRRELGVRLALGSSRARLVAHSLTEGLALAAIAGAGAVAVAVGGARLLRATILTDVSIGTEVSHHLVLFTSIATLGTTLLTGLLPALWTSRPSLVRGLQGFGGRSVTFGGAGLRRGLVGFQAALSAVLLVGAGLFVASLRSASHYDLGWDSEHTAVVRLERGFSEGESGDTPALTRNQMWDLYARLEVALTRVPGVEGAARTASVPMGPSFRLPVLTPGSDTAPRLPSGPPDISAAAPGYFAVMRQPVLRGRAFRNSDLNETDEPVVVVNRALAEQVWPEQDALSSCLRVGGTTAPCARVVGVVETHTTSQLGEEPKMMVWVPIMRTPLRGVFGVVVRTAGDPTKRFGAIRDAALALSPGIRYVEVSRLADGVERQLRPWRLGADLCSIFGALALIVAVVGLYGLLAFEVAQRRFEMGIRATMGATRGTLIRHVMADGIATVAVGTSVGLAAAALTVPRLAPLLFGTSPWDGRVFAGVAVVLLLVAAASSWFPALKGGTVDPAEALRAE